MWLLDQRATTHGWSKHCKESGTWREISLILFSLGKTAPHWYSTYRFYLSIVVGFSIIATLTGTSYFGVGSGAGVPMLPTAPDVKRDEDKAKKQRINKTAQKNHPKVAGKQEGVVAGPVEAVDLVAEESGEGFVKLHNKEKEAEQAEAEEEEKRAKVSRDVSSVCFVRSEYLDTAYLLRLRSKIPRRLTRPPRALLDSKRKPKEEST